MVDVEGCIACDLSRDRRPRPGGLIHRTRYWLVEHCVGPLGVGTLVVKPARHVVRVADLRGEESVELGPLLRHATRVVAALSKPDQVYVCLWSEGPAHIHFVVQPITQVLRDRFEARGPALQAAMFASETLPEERAVTRFAHAAREEFRASVLELS